jgi:hypothetical protein
MKDANLLLENKTMFRISTYSRLVVNGFSRSPPYDEPEADFQMAFESWE